MKKRIVALSPLFPLIISIIWYLMGILDGVQPWEDIALGIILYGGIVLTILVYSAIFIYKTIKSRLIESKSKNALETYLPNKLFILVSYIITMLIVVFFILTTGNSSFITVIFSLVGMYILIFILQFIYWTVIKLINKKINFSKSMGLNLIISFICVIVIFFYWYSNMSLLERIYTNSLSPIDNYKRMYLVKKYENENSKNELHRMSEYDDRYIITEKDQYETFNYSGGSETKKKEKGILFIDKNTNNLKFVDKFDIDKQIYNFFQNNNINIKRVDISGIWGYSLAYFDEENAKDNTVYFKISSGDSINIQYVSIELNDTEEENASIIHDNIENFEFVLDGRDAQGPSNLLTYGRNTSLIKKDGKYYFLIKKENGEYFINEVQK
ncbi:MAG TPA: hypothetical protein DEP72_00270 [Clostridiales bacterium]|nr:MAG: hypothetical protein A2Y18_08675 [Clostridiales bacterium GWD2_32_19]HCC06587.1 hypothetical protein [Clostridiales bacterium]